jgi:hypothetical protein
MGGAVQAVAIVATMMFVLLLFPSILRCGSCGEIGGTATMVVVSAFTTTPSPVLPLQRHQRRHRHCRPWSLGTIVQQQQGEEGQELVDADRRRSLKRLLVSIHRRFAVLAAALFLLFLAMFVAYHFFVPALFSLSLC